MSRRINLYDVISHNEFGGVCDCITPRECVTVLLLMRVCDCITPRECVTVLLLMRVCDCVTPRESV